VDDWVSPFHAQILKEDQYVLVDLGSTSGIHHNGQRVVRTVLQPGDVFAIGRHDFVFRDGSVYSFQDRGVTVIEAYDLTVQVDNRPPFRRHGKVPPLIDDVSFVVRRGTLLGVVGPSGSGKSTLLKAITGVQPATQGRLLFEKSDLYERPGPTRGIGMVPQDDAIHRTLTVRRALRFAASLRCPRGLTRRQLAARLDEVVELLEVAPQLSTRIDRLSGGQRKRTSVAMELLTVPPVLCLDEPTSGLDPSLDRDVMGALRDLANDEKTVIVATHNPMHLDACDYVLVMCLGGRMAYFGPPGAALLDFFGPGQNYADVFSKITDEPAIWAQRYRNSEAYLRYVGEEQLRLLVQESARRWDEAPTAPIVVATPIPTAGAVDDAPRPRVRVRGSTQVRPTLQDPLAAALDQRPPTPARQLVTLCLRMAALILADPKYLLLLVGMPLALAGLSHLVPGHHGLGPDAAGYSLEANRLLAVLVVGAAFMGLAAPIREIVSEVDIYKRERAVGVSPTAYLLSKFIMFVIIDAIQCTVLVELTLLGRRAPQQALVLPDATVEVTLAVTLVAIAATALGLLISTLARTIEQTMPYLVVSVMAQLVLSGALFPLAGQTGLEIFAWLDPSRWGYAAAAATTNLINFPVDDPLWHHETGNWWRSVIILGLQTVALLGAARWALRRYEHGRG
jgi:ABC-type multidrug transport system ATPase subunit